MPIDLNTKEGRKSFIKDNLTNLIEGVNDSYGPIILEELLKRIEVTISDFNDEMIDVFSLLQEKEIKRKEAYDKLSLNEDGTSKNAWEQKLEDIKTQKK
tara:strand:+ start:1661 stop:1957 length:297 start_codon:yes stop_codon:yes gene_type:complete